MSKMQAGIIGVGSYVPEKVLTNNDLEKIVETNDEWIVSRTGIKTRHIAEENELASDLATHAATQALKDAKLAPHQIDLIIVATSTPDMHFPSTACVVQDKLGCTNASAFDLSAACSGFIYGLVTAQQFINTGTYKYALVIGAEVLSKVVDWQDRTTCVLFGDGAGAVVLGPVEQGQGIVAAKLAAEGAGRDCLTLPCVKDAGPFSAVQEQKPHIFMHGREVYKFAVKVMVEGAEAVLKQAGITKEEVSLLIPHQANIRIIEHAAKKLEMPLEKVMANVEQYGNTSAASIPIALAEAYQQGRIKAGQYVVLVGFGGGLTWGAALIRWV